MINRISKLFENEKEKGRSSRAILLELGMSEYDLSEWKRGKSKPTIEKIIKIAKYFNVSTDYLLGLVDYPEPIGQIYGRLDKDEKNKVWRLLIDLFPDKSGKASS